MFNYLLEALLFGRGRGEDAGKTAPEPAVLLPRALPVDRRRALHDRPAELSECRCGSSSALNREDTHEVDRTSLGVAIHPMQSRRELWSFRSRSEDAMLVRLLAFGTAGELQLCMSSRPASWAQVLQRMGQWVPGYVKNFVYQLFFLGNSIWLLVSMLPLLTKKVYFKVSKSFDKKFYMYISIIYVIKFRGNPIFFVVYIKKRENLYCDKTYF
jgi:hypothetical protein